LGLASRVGRGRSPAALTQATLAAAWSAQLNNFKVADIEAKALQKGKTTEAFLRFSCGRRA
jgi:hypothetical protein